jgi:hypothetical protein
MKHLAIALLVSAVLVRPAAAAQFSADIVDGAGTAVGRIAVADERARIEAADFPDGFFLVDGAAHAAWFVKPAQRLFMAAKQSSRLSRLLVPLDAADPCARWQAMAADAGLASSERAWRCETLRGERIDGVDTVEIRATPPGQPAFSAWVAPELRFALRLETADGAVLALAHLVRAPQPAALFVIPAAFRSFDPAKLIERLKQSDVWVEPPK